MSDDPFLKLWPMMPPQITITTGEIGNGKSTFTQNTGASPDRTCVLDFEKSQKGDDDQLHFGMYTDVQAEMTAKYPNGFTRLQLYDYFVAKSNEVPAGKFDVIVLDNASILEDAITAKVETNPKEFGLSPNQITDGGGLKWGAVKDLYGYHLNRLASKCKMVFVVVHLRDKWNGKKPMLDEYGKVVREPKGKDTLEQLSSLFVWVTTGTGGVPWAKVIKARMARKIWVADPANPPEGVTPEMVAGQLNGEPGNIIVQVLPPRLPKCTWPAIREYMRNPVGFRELRRDEVLSRQEMSDDDRLKLRALAAQNEADAAASRLAESEMRSQGQGRTTTRPTSMPLPAPAKPKVGTLEWAREMPHPKTRLPLGEMTRDKWQALANWADSQTNPKVEPLKKALALLLAQPLPAPNAPTVREDIPEPPEPADSQDQDGSQDDQPV